MCLRSSTISTRRWPGRGNGTSSGSPPALGGRRPRSAASPVTGDPRLPRWCRFEVPDCRWASFARLRNLEGVVRQARDRPWCWRTSRRYGGLGQGTRGGPRRSNGRWPRPSPGPNLQAAASTTGSKERGGAQFVTKPPRSSSGSPTSAAPRTRHSAQDSRVTPRRPPVRGYVRSMPPDRRQLTRRSSRSPYSVHARSSASAASGSGAGSSSSTGRGQQGSVDPAGEGGAALGPRYGSSSARPLQPGASAWSPVRDSCRHPATSSWGGTGCPARRESPAKTSTSANCATARAAFDYLAPWSPEDLVAYGRICGWTLARAHARSGSNTVPVQ